ncbi:sensor histidine kinase [Yinghuangia seranimata]|uniref:sensor histidine kinase n=1 Tax=Yinghuangia seranimata TaxID=408067 RepID=UPI00248AEE4D|nr:histidine kinase [Yinghuangia seranimata]MDI2126502.1 histidine kinase [Yinghuangia seranimata]
MARVGSHGEPRREGEPAGASGRTRVTAVLATGLFAVAVAEVVVAVVGAATGMTWHRALDRYIVTNSAMGLAFPVSGVLVAWHRPRNPIGWLLLAAGVAHATTAALVPVIDLAVRHDGPVWLIRALITVATWSWPWAIGLFLPLALQLFPDGRPVFPRLMWATVLTSPLFAVRMGTEPDPFGNGFSGYAVGDPPGLEPLWTAVEIRNIAALAVGLAALARRYRRGGERERRQLLWLMQAVLLVAVIMVPWGVFGVGPVYVLFAIPLIPASMTVAILRHQLLDIRLVFSRTVLYTLLTAGVVGAYLGMVALLEAIARDRGLGGSTAVTVLIAVAFNPVRVWLQRVVERILYGDRGDPVRAVSRVGARLDTGLPGVLEAVRDALRLPFAALRVRGAEVAASGTVPEHLETIPLTYGGERVGELLVGPRSGEQRLSGRDRAVVELLAAPLAVAVHAVALSEQLQRSREALVSAREEERRRLRRDIHDGLGPVLTGVTLKADAAGNLLDADPASARVLIAELRTETAQALDDVRRLVYELRPPALDDLGLAGAIRHRAAQFDRTGPAVRVEAAELPALSAAVEAAAYRIAVEAVTNAVRHSGAGRIRVRLRVDERSPGAPPGPRHLHVEVADDGGTPGAAWHPGVGIRSMHERAAEVGGTCTVGPATDGGGRVAARLPLGSL